jgi:molybdate-binding protein/DNA-binding transcriptional regulator YhcF (GntR family)
MHTVRTYLDLTIMPDESAYRQIADYFRTQVALGKMKPDERLPAIRDLAQMLALDPGTVARGYRELEQEGTIVTRQGKGSFIASTTKNLTELRKKKLGVVVEKAILEALGLGFSVEEIEATLTLHLSGWRERRSNRILKTSSPKHKGAYIRFAGSHDLAIELLAVHLSTFSPVIHLSTNFVGSLPGLMALERGEADIVGAHLFDEETGQYNVAYAKKLIPNEPLALVNLVQRIQGLIIQPGNPKHIVNVRDLIRPEITFVNRQKGSGTRILLDAELRRQNISSARINGYNREETTHSAIAGVISQGEADVGLGAQSSASAAGLDFIPISKERYDLILVQAALDNAGIQSVLAAIRQESFREMLRSIPGYDLNDTGNITRVT